MFSPHGRYITTIAPEDFARLTQRACWSSMGGDSPWEWASSSSVGSASRMVVRRAAGGPIELLRLRTRELSSDEPTFGVLLWIEPYKPGRMRAPVTDTSRSERYSVRNRKVVSSYRFLPPLSGRLSSSDAFCFNRDVRATSTSRPATYPKLKKAMLAISASIYDSRPVPNDHQPTASTGGKMPSRSSSVRSRNRIGLAGQNAW
jgi:hypothetical protein